MEINESVESINRQLQDTFGVDSISGQPIWRIVWSEDQFEKRLCEYTDSGIQLLTPELREVPKYRQWIPNKWVLEQLVIVPEVNLMELGGKKISYEPMFPFEDKNGNYLPPDLEVAKFVINSVYAAMGKSSLAKYKEDLTPEAREERLQHLERELFGNETRTGDALAHKHGVGFTTSKTKVH